jgi:hypothetical protein
MAEVNEFTHGITRDQFIQLIVDIFKHRNVPLTTYGAECLDIDDGYWDNVIDINTGITIPMVLKDISGFCEATIYHYNHFEHNLV